MDKVIYFITDIHGRLDLLNSALMNIERRRPGLVIFGGDYCDRGPDTKGVYERLMAGPSQEMKDKGWKWVCLAGNHDLWFYDVIRNYAHSYEWLFECGGGETMRSYGFGTLTGQIDRRFVPKEHLDWIKSLPLYYEGEHQVFVHAALDITKDMKDQTEAMLTWGYWRGRDFSYRGKYIVHGHDSNPQGPFIGTNRCNMDVRSFKSNKLCVAVFDGPGKPIEIWEEKI